ncbi:M28 family peptidase [Massilia sp. NEAU-DD11]|uniref:M28 family peptidase n=1 Tax=Massilia cellulosiltytica TaxID=2683234 RepID=A0A7X3FVN4_9BURK|nr:MULTISPECIES: M28 family peptidase [Telluria group]MVW58720.1 M28 family peptidase [Telluria cellulosilytica]
MRHVPRPAVWAACGLAFLLAWLMLQPRAAPVPTGPFVPGFSAARAQAHVQVLAQAPRPAGSVTNARARAYLLARIRALGLEPEVQVDTVSATSWDWMSHGQSTMATARNIVVRKRGGARHGAVLAMAHYDSAAPTPGAADGGASAAALLETMRVLQAGPPLDNDLLFVFTDADTVQAMGARAFMQSHPWAKQVRVALRFDNAGNRGPLELIDAAHADGFALDAWARAAPQPQGSSFMAELYDRLPQSAGAAPLATGAFPVLHFATTQGPLGREGMHDVPQRLSSASLQHEGETMLALLRRLGNANLALVSPPHGQVYFALPLAGMVHYDARLTWPLALLCCALGAWACRAALRNRISATDIVDAMFSVLFITICATFAAYLCREALPVLQARYPAAVLADDSGVRWQLAAFMLVPAAVFIALQRRLQQRLGVAATALGVLLAADVALVATCVRAPGASYVLAWPLLAGQAAWLVLMGARAWTPARRAAIAAAGALPALVLLLPAVCASFAFFTPAWLVLPSSLVCLLAGLCGMALDALARRWLVRPLLAGAGVAFGMAYAAVPQVPDLPAPNRLVYYKDTPSWQAFWLHPAGPLDAWTRQVFPNTLHPYPLPYLFGPDADPVWYAAAQKDDGIAWPGLVIDKDERSPRRRHVEFTLRSKNRAPDIVVRVQGACPWRTSVNGRVLTEKSCFSWRLALHGMGDETLRFAFDFQGDPPFLVYIQERIPGLPARDLPPRPPGLPPLLPLSGTTVAADVLRFP